MSSNAMEKSCAGIASARCFLDWLPSQPLQQELQTYPAFVMEDTDAMEVDDAQPRGSKRKADDDVAPSQPKRIKVR